jgi:membrane protein CcdC involved in cytochrome C biogenesis
MEEDKDIAAAPEPQVYMGTNIYAEGIESLGGESGVRMRGVLPVKLDIPFSGRPMSYRKAIVKPCEISTVKLLYRGGEISGWVRLLSIIFWAVFFVALFLTIRKSVKAKKLTIENEMAVVFLVVIALIVLARVFFITGSGVIMWGFFWGFLIFGLLVSKEVAEKIKEISEKSKKEKRKAKRGSRDAKTKERGKKDEA